MAKRKSEDKNNRRQGARASVVTAGGDVPGGGHVKQVNEL